MYQTLEVLLMTQKRLDFFLAKVGIYTVAYLQNFEYSTNHKYEKDIGYSCDTTTLYQRIKFENLGMYLNLFREVNIITDV